MAAPKFGTLVPNRIFVGGISASTSEVELSQLFSAYGNVKATKIIVDRGGVSKGYGFVTFETEEEAKRLQQESECIVLRERKLNIAPAIKKQPFSRSFDGGTGSPPTVPTSTYYYTNGMGVPYQNGMTFYNTGAPAPGTAIAPPTDPATLYQAAGVFGPQATTSHQTFAPVMYPVPAPSLYMPQQYQYSPMPYEPYFPGTTAAGAPQFVYATNGAQATSSSSGNGSANGSSGSAAGAGVGATSPPSGAPSLGPSPSQFQAHFYGPAGAGSHHHPGTMAGGPHAPPPPPPQMEHLYYSYPAPPHAAQPPQHHGGPLTLAGDQQLLIYSTDMSGPSSVNDSQLNQQEDNRSTSSHSEQLQPGGGAATTDSGGGAQTTAQPPDPSAPTILPLMPLKYPPSNRYANFQPISLHSASLQQQAHQTQTSEGSNGSASAAPTSTGEEPSGGPVHYRAMSIYPASLYLPHAAAATAQYHGAPGASGTSLLPTPNQQPFDYPGPKYHREYGKAGLLGNPYGKGPAPGGPGLVHQPSAYVKQLSGPALQSPVHSRLPGPPSRLPHQQQYGKRAVPAYYLSHKSCQYTGPGPRAGPPFVYGSQAQLTSYVFPHPGHAAIPKGFAIATGYETGRRSLGHEESGYRQFGRRPTASSYRGSNLTISTSSHGHSTGANGRAPETSNGAVASPNSSSNNASSESNPAAKPAEPSAVEANPKSSNISSSTRTTETEASSTPGPKAVSGSSDSSSPQTASYSSTTRPCPNISPSPNPNQVQFFGSGSGGTSSSQRYNNQSGGSLSQQQQQQQQRGGGNRYPLSSGVTGRGGKASSALRQPNGGKYKMNGVVQASGKLSAEEAGLGGAGDAPPVGRMPLTPPGTPQQQTPGEQSQLADACHQMQALSI